MITTSFSKRTNLILMNFNTGELIAVIECKRGKNLDITPLIKDAISDNECCEVLNIRGGNIHINEVSTGDSISVSLIENAIPFVNEYSIHIISTYK